MVTCPRCKSQLEDGAAFCDNCGARLTGANTPLPPSARQGLTCPKCGQPVVAGAAFCDNCGAALSDPVAPSPSRQPAAARSPICPSCGTAASVGAAFCDNCGASLSPALPQPAAKIGTRLPPAYVSPMGTAPRLVVQPINASLPFPSGKTEVIAGREDPISKIFPDVNLSPYDPDKGGVSRRHAKFSLSNGQWQIEDLNSTNFTFLNKQRIQPGRLCLLNNGDEIRLGHVTMTFFTN